jgi:hypothetical protein
MLLRFLINYLCHDAFLLPMAHGERTEDFSEIVAFKKLNSQVTLILRDHSVSEGFCLQLNYVR